MADMFLVCGISGSGKTTFSKEFARKNDLLRLGIDDFYAKLNGDERDRANKFEVWIEFFKAIHQAEVNGISCVIDTNALTEHQRREFVEWFSSFGHHLIYIEADQELRKSNNKSRLRQIPDWRLEEMNKMVERPNIITDKVWESIAIIKNINNNFSEPVFLKGKWELEKTNEC